MEWVIGIAAAAVVIGTIIAAVIRKKKGKNSCGCDCSSCCGCCSRNKTKPEQK